MSKIEIIGDSVFQINGDPSAHIIEGTGQETVSSILKEFPLYKRDFNTRTTNIVVLRGFMIGGQFVPFIPVLSKKQFKNFR